MSSFRSSWNTSSNKGSYSEKVNRFSAIKKTKCIDLTDSNLFPSLDGTIVDTHSNAQKEDSKSVSTTNLPTETTKECEYSETLRPWCAPEKEPEEDNKDTVPPGWVILTLENTRKVVRKPEPMPETDDDEDLTTMLSNKPLKRAYDPDVNVELTTEQMLELFRLEVARHNRDVSEEEEDYDLYDYFADEYEYDWKQDSDPYFSADEDYYMDEDDEEDYDDYYN